MDISTQDIIRAEEILKTIKYYRKKNPCHFMFEAAIDLLKKLFKQLDFIYALNLLKYCKKDEVADPRQYHQINNFFIPFDFDEKIQKIEKHLNKKKEVLDNVD